MSNSPSRVGLVPAARDAVGLVWGFRLDPDHRCFEGHFDGAAVLPGVVHIALAASAQAARAGQDASLVGVRDVRFTRPVRPGDDVAVHLSAGDGGPSVRFEIRANGAQASSGILLLASSERD